MAQVPGLSPRTGCRTGVTTVRRTPGELFYAPECPPSFLHLLVEGRVSVALLTSEGKSLVTGVLQPGDVLGNLSLCVAASDGDNELRAASERLEELAYRPVEARVAAALVRIAGNSGRVGPARQLHLLLPFLPCRAALAGCPSPPAQRR